MAKSGDVEINTISSYSEIPKGESRVFEYNIYSVEGENYLFDPDYCISPELAAGTAVKILTRVDGELIENNGVVNTCLTAPTPAGGEPTPHNLSFDIIGKSTGDVNLTIVVEGQNSGNVLASINETISIVKSDGGDAGGSGNSGDDDDNDDGSPGENTLLKTVIENPVKAGVIGIGGTIVLKEAISVDE